MSAKTNKKLRAIAKTLPQIDRANPVYISYSRAVTGEQLISQGIKEIEVEKRSLGKFGALVKTKQEVKKGGRYKTSATTTIELVDHFKEVKRCYDVGGMKAVEAYCDKVYKIAREKKPKPEPTVI